MSKMRAKLHLNSVAENIVDGQKNGERLSFNAVAANAYPEDGSDENNTYAKWTPDASVNIYISNPALFDQFKIGEEYYVDFTSAA